MLNVLYVIDDLRAAGAQKHLVTLVNGLDKRNYSPYVIAINKGGRCAEELREAGVFVHICKIDSIHSLKIFRTILFLIKFIKAKKIRIIHTYLLLGDILGTLAGIFTSAKIITTRREMGFWNKSHVILTYRFLNLFCNRIIAVSNAVRRYTIYQERIIDRKKIVAVYNGVNIKKFDRKKENCKEKKRKEIGLNNEEMVFGIVANLLPVKGHKYFIKAFKLLSEEKEMPEMRALFIGDGNLRYELENIILSENLREKIIFLGVRNDVLDLLEAIDIFVLPSLAEGMSNALIEALFMGKPVITTNTGGNPEVIGRNAGILVEPKDVNGLFLGMKKYTSDFKYRREKSNQAVKRAHKHFSAEKMCNKYKELYSELA